ncbi:DarT1-associated NADAR antitoxin family protein [Hornefia butyriciproducens]|uniref:DarT1-associated NADAR antitoxin family protein n=1 Tax=Hornefia butyriciproducens TaxID=2652293 RepID=UPI0023F0807E|nr:hypothetical protein [Hornefia butyriciproducens]MDD6299885.1 hypothetical protein [Hornefia butyriciproducens]MDY6212811.1 hypothetical protein [Hornefia butyriciproducens]
MAEKKIFLWDAQKSYEEKIISYTYFPGFAISQKQKCIDSLHASIKKKYPDKKILEISTKSSVPLGRDLSAFNLLFFHKELREGRNVESVFQSSKVFSKGGPFRDLLNVSGREAKKDPRLRESGELIAFNLYEENWPLEPESMFYDWIYVSALKDNRSLAEKLIEYDIFTDIEFNYKKSINCQARAAAIFVSLCKTEQLEKKTRDREAFRTVYSNIIREKQIRLSEI